MEEEEQQQFSIDSREETCNAEDEPDSDTDEIRADLNYRINQYLSTEQ